MFVFYPFSAFLRLPNCPVPRSFIPRISAISMFMAAFCALPLPVWRFDLKQIKNQFTIQSHFKAVIVTLFQLRMPVAMTRDLKVSSGTGKNTGYRSRQSFSQTWQTKKVKF